MKENLILADLWEQARTEPPQLSFDEVTQRFEATAPTGNILARLLQKFIHHLNAIVMTILGGALFALIFFTVNPTATEEAAVAVEPTVSTQQVETFIPPQAAPLSEEASASNKSSVAPTPRTTIPVVAEPSATASVIDSPTTVTPSMYQNPVAVLPSPTQLETVPSTTTAELHRTPMAAPILKSVQAVLHATDDPVAADEFLKTITDRGIKARLDLRFKKRQGKKIIKKFTLQLADPVGLDCTLKATGFNKFELFWQEDETGTPVRMSYRFNDQDTKNIPLDGKVRNGHFYSKKDGKVKGGRG